MSTPQRSPCDSPQRQRKGSHVARHPDDVLRLLQAGNERFARGDSLAVRRHAVVRRQSVDLEQPPHAAIVGCSDCQCALETIFDSLPGRKDTNSLDFAWEETSLPSRTWAIPASMQLFSSFLDVSSRPTAAWPSVWTSARIGAVDSSWSWAIGPVWRWRMPRGSSSIRRPATEQRATNRELNEGHAIERNSIDLTVFYII